MGRIFENQISHPKSNKKLKAKNAPQKVKHVLFCVQSETFCTDFVFTNIRYGCGKLEGEVEHLWEIVFVAQWNNSGCGLSVLDRLNLLPAQYSHTT